MWDEVGFVPLNRGIIKNALWKKPKVFSEVLAWIDLIMGASWEDEMVRVKGNKFNNEIGCIHVTQSFLAIRWKWDQPKVSRFLQYLCDEEMISLVRLKKMTIIRLLNYDEYNKFSFDKEPVTSPVTSPITSITTLQTTLKDTSNNPLIDKDVYASNGALNISLVAKKLGDVIALNSTSNIASNKTLKKDSKDKEDITSPITCPTTYPITNKKENNKRIEINNIKETNKENIAALSSSLREELMRFIVRNTISYLNIKSNKKFHTASDSATTLIPERIREGYSVNDLHLLIDYYVGEWMEGRATADIIHPERLFRQIAIDNMINPEEAEGDEAAKKKRDKEIDLIKQVLDYLNKKTHRVGKYAYLYTTPEYQNKILTRCAEGYKLEDFKHVVDVKVSEWLGDRKMEVFLRPTTLFGPKFKEYEKQTPLKIPKYRQVAAGQRLSKTRKLKDDD